MRRVLLRYHELADNGQCVGSLIPCLPAKLLEPGALQRNICRFPVDESASFYADVCTLCLNPAPLLFARRSKKRRTTLFSAGYTSHAPQLQIYHRTTFVILVCRFVALSIEFILSYKPVCLIFVPFSFCFFSSSFLKGLHQLRRLLEINSYIMPRVLAKRNDAPWHTARHSAMPLYLY